MLEIYTDGGCVDNGKKDAIGAWAFTASDGAEQSGVLFNTTSNRCELWAVIEAIRYADSKCLPVTIYSDSNITVNCGNKEWKRKSNLDLWTILDSIKTKRHTLKWVKGHSGIEGNEKADKLCRNLLTSV